jgi:hypothetical protein
LELRAERDKGKLLHFPLGGSKTDDCTWAGSLLVSVEMVCGTREKVDKSMGQEKKDEMKKNTKPNNEKSA